MSKYLLLSFTILFCWLQASGQGQTVSGVITDAETGEGIPGANVLVKGTSSGTVSDIEGNYSIALPDGATTLVYSFVGYVTEEIEVGSRSVIDISLTADVTSLTEVVVVGYGIQEKKEITSAIASVKSEDFNQGNISNPAQLLQGKVAGLNISAPSGGNPFAGFNIRLRGVSSVGENTSPLIIVDGVIGVDLNSVDPNDIESMDVLKDGSAAAIYGTRASAGVIIITTRKGSEGKVNVDYNGFVAFDMIARQNESLSANEFRQYLEALGSGNDQDFGADTDWQKEITRTGISQVHNLALSGGTSKLSYRASATYRGVNGVLKTTGFDQLNARINLEQKLIKDKVRVRFQAATNIRKSDFGYDDAFRYALIHNPTAPVFAIDDNMADQFGGFFNDAGNFNSQNPVAMLEQNVNQGEDRRMLFGIGFSWDIISNLTWNVDYSLNEETDFRDEFISPKSKFNNGTSTRGRAKRSADNRENSLFESTLVWNWEKDRWNGTLMGGYSYQLQTNDGFQAQGRGVADENLLFNDLKSLQQWSRPTDGLSLSEFEDVKSYKDDNTLIGMFARLNFNYDDTYFFMASIRREGSSKFGTNNKWGNFPAFSVGADFARLAGISSMENLKLRIGYGVTGNLPKDSYLSIQKFEVERWDSIQGRVAPVYTIRNGANPDLKWETKTEWNIGLDYSFSGGKFNGAIDYYIRNTTDFIVSQTVPVPPNPFNTLFINAGELQNSGIEVLFNWAAVDKADFSYSPSINFTYLESKIIDLAGNESFQQKGGLGSPGLEGVNTIIAKEGEPIGQMWAVRYGDTADDGTLFVLDKDGNPIEYTTPNDVNDDDRKIVGEGLPKFTWGFSNVLNYKNWDFNVFFRGAFGHSLVNTNRVFYETSGNFPSLNMLSSVKDYSNLPPRFNAYTDRFVEKANFMVLDNLTIGYSLNVDNSQVFTRVRFFATGQNLFYVTNYSGISPEVRYEDNGDPLAPGIERRNTWGTTRTVSIGANLTF